MQQRLWEDQSVKCFFDDNDARGVCRFCGRATCKDHAEKRLPYITTIYVGASNTPKATRVITELILSITTSAMTAVNNPPASSTRPCRYGRRRPRASKSEAFATSMPSGAPT